MLPEPEALASFHPTERLIANARPAPEWREELRRIPNVRNAFAVFFLYAQTIAIIVAAVWIDNWLVWILAFLLMGRAHAQFAALMHEAAHRLLFRNRRINDWVGRWLLGFPSFTPIDLYRRGHMAHHRDEFGPDEPDIPLYRGYPIPRDSMRRKLTRDALGKTGWKLFKGLLRGVNSSDAPVRSQARRIVAVQLLLIAIGIGARPPVGLLHPVAGAVPHRVARDQPLALDRRARRDAAFEGPPAHDAHGAAALAGALRARAVSHRLAPRAPRRLRRPDGEPAEAARRAAPRRLRHRRARVLLLPRALEEALEPLSTVPAMDADDPPLDAPLAEVMYAQAPVRRLLPDPVDDDTVLTLLDLASRATAGQRRRVEFVVVRDPEVRHQLARSYRQGWSIYRRVLHSRLGDDAVLAARQWEADHFEDVPVLVVACVHGRRPVFPAIGAASFYSGVFPAVQNLLLGACGARPRRRREHPRVVVTLGGATDPRPARVRDPRGGRADRPAEGRARAGAGRPRRQPRAPRPVRPPALSVLRSALRGPRPAGPRGIMVI